MLHFARAAQHLHPRAARAINFRLAGLTRPSPRAFAPNVGPLNLGAAQFTGVPSEETKESESDVAASVGDNRWKYLPACFVGNLPFGAFYAWSVFQDPLAREYGVLAQAANDWDLAQTLPVFTVNGIMLGAGAMMFGTWIDKVGAKKAIRIGALTWTSAMLIAAAGTKMHQIEVVYAGIGLIGGLGLSLGYLSAIAFIQKWFPDRRALAAGVSVAGFGGGSIICAPLAHGLIEYFHKPPTFVGTADSLEVKIENGMQVANIDGSWQEVSVQFTVPMPDWQC